MRRDFATYNADRILHTFVEDTIRNPAALHCGTQDCDVSFPVIRNAVDIGIHSEGFEHRLMERVVVHQVARN